MKTYGSKFFASFGLVAVAIVFAIAGLSGDDQAAKPAVAKSPQSLAAETGSRALELTGASKPKDPLAGQVFVPDTVIVRYDRSATAAQRAAARRSVGAKVKRKLALAGAEVLELPRNSSETGVAKRLERQDGVRYSEPDAVMRTTVTPNDPEFGSLWALNNTGQDDGTADADIDAPEAWDVTTGSADTVVAVIDTGVDYLHTDLNDNIWANADEVPDNDIDDDNNGFVDDTRGWNFIGAGQPEENDPMDDHFHGTHVAGTIAAEGDNGEGVAGVAWDAQIMPVKVLGSNGSGTSSGVADGMLYAAENGAQIANLSLGSSYPSQYQEDVIAAHPETLFVIAAGNDANNNDSSTKFYPCSHPEENIVCTAATTRTDSLAYFSNYGKKNVDLGAPGYDILSTKASVVTDPAGGYDTHSGTSMAAPHVAGTAALLASEFPGADTQQIRDALLDGAERKPSLSGKVASGARLNANLSLAKLDAAINRDPNTTTVEVSGAGDLRYIAAQGQANQLVIDEGPTKFSVIDTSATIIPGTDCVSVSSSYVQCLKQSVNRINIRTGDGDDNISMSTDVGARIDGGAGNDTIAGGGSDDTFVAGDGADTMHGQGGFNTMDYSSRSAAVSASVDGVANDGAAGEGDELINIQRIVGGAGDDELHAINVGGTLDGRGGDDELQGSVSDDTLIGGAGSDQVYGNAGNDLILPGIKDGNDSYFGGDGVDLADGSTMSDDLLISLDDVANDGWSGEQDNYASDIENLTGGIGGDTLVGSIADNVISGGDGRNNVLDGGPGGADEFFGGGSRMDIVDYSVRSDDLDLSIDDSANDGAPGENDNIHSDVEHIRSGSGDDELTGDDGSNDGPLYGLDGTNYAGEDILDGGLGADVIQGLEGRDVATYITRPAAGPVTASIDGLANDGESGEGDMVASDVEGIAGGYGDDTLSGSSGDETLFGGWAGNDALSGGGGDDILDGSAGSDSFAGGDGDDMVTYSGNWATLYQAYWYPVSVTLDGQDNDGYLYTGEADSFAADIESFEGSMEDDTLIGGSQNDRLHGSSGEDILDGAGGDDRVTGDAGTDQVNGGTGDDRVEGDISFYARTYFMGDDSSGTIFWGSGNNIVHGDDGNDTVRGGTDDEQLYGDAGGDELDGSYGADVMSGGDGNDTVAYRYRPEFLSLTLNGVADDGWIHVNGGSGEKDQIESDVENLIGSYGDDELVGNENSNRLDGSRGNDSLESGGGVDTLIGGDGTDDIDAGAEDDRVFATDGEIDDITCGDGADDVDRDSTDTIPAADCEGSGSPAPRVAYTVAGTRERVATYESLGDVSDSVVVTLSGADLVFTATGHDLSASTGCDQLSASQVSCDYDATADNQINAKLFDQNDDFLIGSGILAESRIYGGDGNDTLTGGAGEDVIDGGLGMDLIAGGGGALDAASYSSRTEGISARLNGLADDGAIGENDQINTDIEVLTGGNGNDILVGDAGNNRIYGQNGDDIMDGGFGTDWLIGGINSTLGVDTVTYESRTAPVQITPVPVQGEYFFDPEVREFAVSGEAGENDWVGSDVEKLIGGSGDDDVNCYPWSGPGSTVLVGGPGSDSFGHCEGDEANGSFDTVSYENRVGDVSATLDGFANDGEQGEQDEIGPGVEAVVGGSGDDDFAGDALDNKFTGGDGNDGFSIHGGGVDAADCGAGDDEVTSDFRDSATSDCETISSETGVFVDGSVIRFISATAVDNNLVVNDSGTHAEFVDTGTPLVAGSGCETVGTYQVSCVKPAEATLTVDLGAGDDSVTNTTSDSIQVLGRGGNDTIDGGIGDDQLDGGDGDDTIDGGPGEDSIQGGDGADAISIRDGIQDTADCGAGIDSADVDYLETPTNCESVTSPNGVKLEGSTIYFDALGDDANSVVVQADGDYTLLSDPAAELQAAAGCEQLTAYSARCLTPSGGTVEVRTGDGADAIDNQTSLILRAIAGADDDLIQDQAGDSELLGEAGDDTIAAGGGDDLLSGGDGNDSFEGGLGADVFDGQDGFDTADYSSRSANLSLITDYGASDGEPGEGDDLRPTIERVIGGSGDDTFNHWDSQSVTFVGGPGNDTLWGNGGSDTLDGGTGDDSFYSGHGNDTITGGDGTDWLNDAGGTDTVSMGSGNDQVMTGGGFATVELGDGNDLLNASGSVNVDAGSGDDNLISWTSTSVMNGGDGNDTLSGGTASDQLDGGPGDDVLDGADATDVFIGGDGIDQVSYQSAWDSVNVSLDGAANDGMPGENENIGSDIEFVLGSQLNDTLTAGSYAATLNGSYGDDLLTSTTSTSTLAGDDDNDTLISGTSSDALLGGPGSDTVTYAARTSPVSVSTDDAFNDGESGENDNVSSDIETIRGGEAGDTLTGSAAAETFYGNGGDDALSGGDGSDRFYGGTGNDTMSGGTGSDTVLYSTSTVAVNVVLGGTTGNGEAGESDNIGSDIEHASGGSGNDTLVGDAFNNTLSGGLGNDVVNGRAGGDTMSGNSGVDRVEYVDHTANVSITPGTAFDDGAVGEGDRVAADFENFTGGQGNDTVIGTGVTNVIDGGLGDDVVDGRTAADTLIGGSGSDTVSYSTMTAAVSVWLDGLANDGVAGENDLVSSDIENATGGSGADMLFGDGVDNVLTGGSHGDVLLGGGGSDTFNGGTATDTVSYSYESNPVVATLDGTRNDGIAGENDLIGADVESIQGGNGDDSLTGNGVINQLDGGYGIDTLTGLGGNDSLNGHDGDDVLDGGDGHDVLSGFDGNDHIVGGSGFDTANGQAGDDLIEIRDGEQDIANCGDDIDTLQGDPIDSISNCEFPHLEPETTITGGPENESYTTDNTPTYTFESDDGQATFECNVDTAGWAPCTSPYTVPALTDEPHILEVRAKNAFNVYDSSPDWRVVIVDTTVPSVDVLAPAGLHSTATPTVDFVADDANGVTNVCKVDGNTLPTCTSGMTLPAQADGNHTFSVTATDPAGNFSTAATSFVVDTSAADVSVSGTTMTVVPSVGATNNITVINSGTLYTVTEFSTFSLKAGTGCLQVNATQVTCTVSGLTSIVADTSDQNDQFANNTSVASTLTGGSGNDSLTGGSANDTLNGGPGADNLTGNGGTDLANYAAETAALTLSNDGNANDGAAGEGDNIAMDVENITAGSGNDTINGSFGNGTLNGGGGTDTVTYVNTNSAVTVNLGTSSATGGGGTDTLTSIENATGSGFNDSLTGSTADNTIAGLAGNDVINCNTHTTADMVDYSAASAGVIVSLATTGLQNTVGAGSDTISGCEGINGSGFNDTFTGTTATQFFNGGAGNDTMNYSNATAAVTLNLNLTTAQATGGGGTDTLTSMESANGGSAGDTITPTSGDSAINGNGGTDRISYAATGAATSGVTLALSVGTAQATGGSGSDTVTNVENITGSGFNDTLSGSSGSNSMDGGGGTNTVSYANATAAVTVNLTTTTAQNTVGAGSDTLTNFHNLTGSNFNDTLSGNANANAIVGGTGNDTLNGNNGNDTLTGGDGTDTHNGGAGADNLQSVDAAATVDIVNCGTESDSGNANVADNVNADCEAVIDQ